MYISLDDWNQELTLLEKRIQYQEESILHFRNHLANTTQSWKGIDRNYWYYHYRQFYERNRGRTGYENTLWKYYICMKKSYHEYYFLYHNLQALQTYFLNLP